MSNAVIRVEGLSKQYRIGGPQVKYKTLRESLTEAAKAPFRRIGDLLRGQAYSAAGMQETIWALKDVSFDVQQGEVVGIIGRNGAGKTTLLKILSRITKPTEGRAEIYGRVRSLLEVGTGFHGELTGWENIYLNGAILGMKRAEIERKLDEIVAFSEIEKFINTPVKYYSSGMYVRLAFAVAAHLEPEILIVDEVLSVGDVSFQKKCLGKMGDVAKEGRTVLFVSHNMPAITRLCSRALLLNEGKLTEDGDSAIVVHTYLRSDLGTTAAREWSNLKRAPGDEFVRLIAVRVLNENSLLSEIIDIRKPLHIEMEYEVLEAELVIKPWFHFWNDKNICVFATDDNSVGWVRHPRNSGRYISAVEIPGNLLAEGSLTVTVGMASAGDLSNHFIVNDALVFQVVDTLEGDSARGEYGGSFPGVVRPKLSWSTQAK